MARTIRRVAKYDESIPSQDLTDYWQLEFPVTPKGSASKTDVMLVQALLVTYALSEAPRGDDKQEVMNILNSQPGRFDDGIYGSRTRALLKIFEDQFHFPYKDGIVHPSSEEDMFGAAPEYSKTRGKLFWLNEIWDETMTWGPTKQDQARLAFNPILFSRLYPS